MRLSSADSRALRGLRIAPIRGMRHLFLLVAAVCLWSGGPARGATLQQLSLDEMTAKATAIVHGRALEHYATAQGPTIFTHYRMQVSETLKGTAAGTIEVVLPGGTVGHMRQTFAGIPTLTEGKDYLLFLWTGKGVTQLIGFTQGLFEVSTDASGKTMVSRVASGELMLNRAGTPVQDQPVRMPLPLFTAHVKSIVDKGSK